MKRNHPLLVWTLAGLAGAVIVILAARLIFSSDGSPTSPAEAAPPTSATSPPSAATEPAEEAPHSSAPLAPPPVSETPSAESGGGWLYPTLVLLLLLANLLVASVLYRGRVKFAKDRGIMPDLWYRRLGKVIRKTNQLGKKVDQLEGSLAGVQQNVASALQQLQERITAPLGQQAEALTTLQSGLSQSHHDAMERYDEIIRELAKVNRELDRKDEEIDRLREGYDIGILNQHTKGVVSLYRTVARQREKILEADGDPTPHDHLLLYLGEMLDHLNVSPDQPAPGTPLDALPYPVEIDTEQAEPTDDPQLDGSVAACLEPGFLDPTTTPPHIYRKAKIRLYRHRPAELESPTPADAEMEPTPPTGFAASESPTRESEPAPDPEPHPDPEPETETEPKDEPEPDPETEPGPHPPSIHPEPPRDRNLE